MKYKRYCKALSLSDDPALIEEYKKVHAQGAAWPEVTDGMKQVGIVDMEIYIIGNQLFMIMDTSYDFDHEKAMQKLSTLPRQQEWETFVSRFQVSDSNATADSKWQLMERIYEMDQENEYVPLEGQVKDLSKINTSIIELFSNKLWQNSQG